MQNTPGSTKQTCAGKQCGNDEHVDDVKDHEIRNIFPWQQTDRNNDPHRLMSEHPDRTITLISQFQINVIWCGVFSCPTLNT